MTGGVSRKMAKFRPLTSTPSISPESTWYARSARHRSSVASAVNPDQVHGHTSSHEHDSKYVPSSRQAMAAPSWRGESPTRLPQAGSGRQVRSASVLPRNGLLQHLLQGLELRDLAAHLPGDHRGHELHEPGRPEIQREADDGARAGAAGQLEDPPGPGRAGGDQELQPPRGIEDGDPVVAVDATATGAGQDLAVGRALAGAGGGALDVEDTAAPLAVVGAVREVVEDIAGRPVDGDAVFGV